MIDVLRMYACPCIYVCVCPHIHSTHILDIISLRMYMCMHRFRSTIYIYIFLQASDLTRNGQGFSGPFQSESVGIARGS